MLNETAITHQQFGKRSEIMVAELLRSKGFKVRRKSYCDHVDLLVNDTLQVEVKAARIGPLNKGKYQYSGWRINLHRHGRLIETGVDFYIFRLEGMPEFKAGIHLVFKAPLRTPTIAISFRTLLTRYESQCGLLPSLRRYRKVPSRFFEVR